MSPRRPAFDPTRLDDLADLLPAPAPASTTPPPAVHTTPSAALGSAASPDTEQGRKQREITPASRAPQPTSTPRRARGQGGRPPRRRITTRATAETAESTRVPVAVRIPRSLYEDINIQLLAGPERPSYGQLVVWTCEDHPDEVAAEVRNARPRPGSRRPRGRRLAADTVQVTLRLTLEERGLLDDIADTLRATHPGLITRTEVATAALRFALTTPPTQ
jgi:hypothetical protein